MNKKSDKRSAVTAMVAQHILQEGLAKTSLRQLAAAADLSDRMLLYYFTDKADVMTSALTFIAQGMTQALEAMIPPDKKYTPAEFFVQNAELIKSPVFDPFMGLWVEITAAAVRGKEPYQQVTNTIAKDFLYWIEDRLDIEDTKERKEQAAMILSMIDGLSVVGICIDDDVQDKAMKAMVKTLKSAS